MVHSYILENSLGEVTLIDYMGSDLTIVNSARVSHNKRRYSLSGADVKLIDYLAKNKHYSPFRHCQVQLYFRVPLFVRNQMYKHAIGISATEALGCEKDHAWNELSQRYVSVSDTWVPCEVREKPEGSIKQGSGGPLAPRAALAAKELMSFSNQMAVWYYRKILEAGVCQEQARAFLPVSTFTEFYWTASLQAIANFLVLRLDSHAQKEVQYVAHAVKELTQPLFPYGLGALIRHTHTEDE